MVAMVDPYMLQIETSISQRPAAIFKGFYSTDTTEMAINRWQ